MKLWTKRLMHWYKNHKLKTFLSVLLAVLITVGGVYTGFDTLSKGWQFVVALFGDSKEAQKISKLSTGLSGEYFSDILGKPISKQPVESDNLKKVKDITEYFYALEGCIVNSFVDNKSGLVVAFEVLLRDKNLRLELPFRHFTRDDIDKKLYLGDLSLGTMTEYYSPTNFSFNFSTKLMTYTESYYFGNPGAYKQYLLGYNSVGEDFLSQAQLDSFFKYADKVEAYQEKKKFQLKNHMSEDFLSDPNRRLMIPNAYGVISDQCDGQLKLYLENSEVGIDWFTAKELNLY